MGFVPRAACHMLPMYGQLKVDPESSMSLRAEGRSEGATAEGGGEEP